MAFKIFSNLILYFLYRKGNFGVLSKNIKTFKTVVASEQLNIVMQKLLVPTNQTAETYKYSHDSTLRVTSGLLWSKTT